MQNLGICFSRTDKTHTVNAVIWHEESKILLITNKNDAVVDLTWRMVTF